MENSQNSLVSGNNELITQASSKKMWIQPNVMEIPKYNILGGTNLTKPEGITNNGTA
jgi:hypothetical protein